VQGLLQLFEWFLKEKNCKWSFSNLVSNWNNHLVPLSTFAFKISVIIQKKIFWHSSRTSLPFFKIVSSLIFWTQSYKRKEKKFDILCNNLSLFRIFRDYNFSCTRWLYQLDTIKQYNWECHKFRLAEQDDYFWFDFDHFWSEQYFWRQLGQYWKLARA